MVSTVYEENSSLILLACVGYQHLLRRRVFIHSTESNDWDPKINKPG